jgi:arylsulfatase A-like enzyme
MSTHRNIVVVLCDQLRRQALGCAGDPNVSTPNLDALASDGARFENACSSYPVCVPARFTLLTGEPAHTRGVPAIDYRLSPAEETLADAFGDAGYHTAYTGKWHLGGVHAYRNADSDVDRGRLLNRTPIPRELQGGFDTWRGFELRNGPFDTVYFENDDPSPKPLEGYQTDALFDLAMEDLSETDRPFFHVLSVEPPHPPLVAPQADEDRWADRELTLRPNVPESEADPDLRSDARSYYAMVENLDANVGRLRRFLAESGLDEETVVVFLSDHGELLGSHGLRGKQYPHEESIGVPFLAAGPGIEGDQVVAEPTCSEDWFPTLLGLAGFEPETTGRGVDLSPLVQDGPGGSTDGLDRPGVTLEFVAEYRPWQPFAGEPWRGFRTERFTYTVRGGPEGAEPWHLFDLAEDPFQQQNVIDDPSYEDTARRLHGYLRESIETSTDDYRLKPAFGHDGLGVIEDSEATD